MASENSLFPSAGSIVGGLSPIAPQQASNPIEQEPPAPNLEESYAGIRGMEFREMVRPGWGLRDEEAFPERWTDSPDYQKERNTVSKLLADPVNLGGIAPDILDDAAQSYNPDKFKEIAVNWRATSFLLNTPLDQLKDNEYGFYKSQVAAKLGKPVPKTESEYRSMLAEHFQKEQIAEDAFRDLSMSAILDAVNATNFGKDMPISKDMGQTVRSWMERWPELASEPGTHWRVARAANEAYQSTLADLGEVREEAAQTFDTLVNLSQGKASSEDIQSLANTLVGMTPEQRQKVYQYATLAAQQNAVDPSALSQLAQNIGQSFSRGFDFIPGRVLQDKEAGVAGFIEAIRNGVQIWVPGNGDLSQAVVGNAASEEAALQAQEEGSWRQATTEETEQLLASSRNLLDSFQIARELRDVAKKGVDPIKPFLSGGILGAAESGMLYGLPGSLPLMGATALNPFLGIAAYQAQTYDRLMLENPGMSFGAARTIATLEGAANAAIDTLQIRSLMGKSPILGNLLKGMQRQGVGGFLKRTGLIQLEQFTQENLQDLIAPVTETIAAAIREDMPDKDFGALMGEYLDSRAEVFFAVLPLALLGGGILTAGDFKNPNTAFNQNKLRIAGFNKEARDYVLAAKTQEEFEARYQEKWDQRSNEDIAEGISYANELLAEGKSDPNDLDLSLEQTPDGTQEWVVIDPATKEERIRTPDIDAALEIIGQSTAARVQNDKAGIKSLMEWSVKVLANPDIKTDQAPISVQQMVEEMKANGETAKIENLHARLKLSNLQDKDPTTLFIMGETTVEQLKDGVYRAVIRLRENSNPLDAFEEINHGFVKTALANGKVTLPQLQDWLAQTEAATGRTLDKETEMEVIETISQLSLDYAAGRLDDTDLPQSFVDYLKRIVQIFKDVMVRYLAMREAFDTGKIDSDFESFLAESIGLDTQDTVDRAANQTAAEVDEKRTDYAIRVQTVAANILADRLGVPGMVGQEFVGRKVIPMEADLTGGGGSFTQKPAQGGPAFSVIPENYNAEVAWASAKDGFWTGKLNLAREIGAIYKGKDGREKFLMGTYAMKQDSHISNPTVAGEKLAEVVRYVAEGRVSQEQEQGLADIILKAAGKISDTSQTKIDNLSKEIPNLEQELQNLEADLAANASNKALEKKVKKAKEALAKAEKDLKKAKGRKTMADGLSTFPTTFTAGQFDAYLAGLTFEQRAFIAEKLSSAAAEQLGAPPMEQIRRATLDESFAGTDTLSLISLLEIDVPRLEKGLKDKTLTAEAFGVTPHNSYNSMAPGRIVAMFRTPIPYPLAFPDIREGLLNNNYPTNHGYYLKGKIPKGEISPIPKAQTITDQMLSWWNDAQTSLRPNQAKAIVAALNQKWTTFDKPRQAGLAEFTRALLNNDAAVTLTQYTPKEVSSMLKDGKMKVYRLGEMDVWFALKRPAGDEFDPGNPEKDWSIVSVVNNEKGAPGMLPLIMAKALAEGGTLLDCYAVKSAKYPKGLLPTLYARSGFEITSTLAFDPQYHQEPGKMGELEKVWHSQNWDGQERPPVVYMKWNPELHANLGRDTDARDEIAEKRASQANGRRLARRKDSSVGRVASGSPVSMGGSGQGDGGGRLSDGAGATGDAGNARNILPRGIEQVVADLGKLNEYQLQALGITKAEVDSAIAIYNNPDSVSYAVRKAAEQATKRSAEEIDAIVNKMTASDLREALAKAELTPTPRMVAMLGEFPEYLKPVMEYMLGKRQQLIEGKIKPRDVAKAYWMTIASIGADAIDVDTIAAKAQLHGIDFNPSPVFMTTGAQGQPQMRPEELAAYWLGTPEGQRALDNIEQGIFRPEDWQTGLLLRDAFGRNDLRNSITVSGTAKKVGKYTVTVDGMPIEVEAKVGKDKNIKWSVPVPSVEVSVELPKGLTETRRTDKSGAVGAPKGKNVNLQNLEEFTKRINEAKGDPAKLEKAVSSAVGIGDGKKGFISHFLGFGEWSTIDAVELNIWLTGEGDTTFGTEEQKTIAAIAKKASGAASTRRDIFERIRMSILSLRDTAKGASAIPREVAPHIIHHWIWDAAKGIQTTHEGLYTAMTNYSIRSQEEIDRIAAGVANLNRGPEGRLAVYQNAKDKFLEIMRENKDVLDAMSLLKTADARPALDRIEEDRASRLADLETEEIAEIEQALQDNAVQFAARIEDAVYPEDKRQLNRDAKDRAKILEKGIREKFDERRKALEQEVGSERQKVAREAERFAGTSNALMREKVRSTKLKQAIGELDGLLRVLPKEVIGKVGGFARLANIGTGDKALADFFVQRLEMVDAQLERYLRQEYGEALDKIFKRSMPKKGKPGEKPKGIGADIQQLFGVLRTMAKSGADKVSAHLAMLDFELANSELTAEQEADKKLEAALVTLVGNWKEADSNRRAAAVEALRETWAQGMAAYRAKEIAKREQRETERAEAIASTGKSGDYENRLQRRMQDNGIGGKFRNGFLNLIGWDQFVQTLFGDDSYMANRLADRQRTAENAKEDDLQGKLDELENLFANLAGGSRLAGEQLRYRLGQTKVRAGGLELSELEAITATMMWNQEDGRRHMEGRRDENGVLTSRWGYTQEFITSLEGQLSREAKELRTYLLQKYEDEYNAINRVYRALNGINLPKVANYSPLTVKPMAAPQGMVNDPVTGMAVSAASISPGALRTRGTAVAEPDFRDALQTYLAHTKQMSHWKAFAPVVTEFNAVLRNRDVQNSIEEAGGSEAIRVMNLWLDVFAQGGNRDAANQLDLNQQIAGMTGRAAQVALVGRIGTLLIQSTQLAAASAEMPYGSYVLRLSKLLTGNLGWVDSIRSPYIQRRIKEMPPVVQQALQGLASSKPNRLKHEVARIGRLISGADGLFTAGTYAIVYDYHLTQASRMGLPQPDAEAYARTTAERVTDRLAQPTRAGARSIFEVTATNPFAKVGWAFASEGRKNLALAAYALAKQPLDKKLRTLAFLLIGNALFSSIIRNAWKDARNDEDDEWLDEKNWSPKRMFLAALTEPFQGLPILGQALQEGAYLAAGEFQYDSSLLSGGRAIRAIRNLPATIAGEREAEDILKDINGLLSVMGLFNDNLAATASLSTLAADLFGFGKNTKKELED